MVRKLLFLPFSLAAGILGGLVARKAFAGIWALVDKAEPPDAEHRDISMRKLLLAQALDGAVSRTSRAGADHLARRAFLRWTGGWPGEERPEAR